MSKRTRVSNRRKLKIVPQNEEFISRIVQQIVQLFVYLLHGNNHIFEFQTKP